jgi:N-acetylneuraminate synthase
MTAPLQLRAARSLVIGRPIGPAHPPFVIAELSANHLGSLERALAIVDAAADAGCDAIKLQTFTPDAMTLASSRGDFHIAEGPWQGRSLWELYDEAHTPWDWHPALFARGAARGLVVFSTPFDERAVAQLDRLGAPAFKIASFELVDLELIACAARTGKPLILSTGMASDAEVADAVETARRHGSGGIALLHCVSGYPTPIDQTNLRRLDALARHDTVVGISDHSPGAVVPIAAVARGAAIVEKHLTLRRADGGPDAAFSLEPDEFAALVRSVRDAQAALGDVRYGPSASERSSTAFRRSLFAVTDIAEGEPLTRENVRSIRPGHGLAPRYLPCVLGSRAVAPIPRGTPLRWDHMRR